MDTQVLPLRDGSGPEPSHLAGRTEPPTHGHKAGRGPGGRSGARAARCAPSLTGLKGTNGRHSGHRPSRASPGKMAAVTRLERSEAWGLAGCAVNGSQGLATHPPPSSCPQGMGCPPHRPHLRGLGHGTEAASLALKWASVSCWPQGIRAPAPPQGDALLAPPPLPRVTLCWLAHRTKGQRPGPAARPPAEPHQGPL